LAEQPNSRIASIQCQERQTVATTSAIIARGIC
jgi:hypothetical protein